MLDEMIASVTCALVLVSIIRDDSQTKYSSAVRLWSVAMRQVAMNRVPSQIENTVLVLPQSMASSMGFLLGHSEKHVGGRNGKPLVVVDYANTPDALEQALANLRSHTEGKLICVFGCGGDRDKGKRPVMAAIAERAADIVIVTDDNPRTENGDGIVQDIQAGFSHLSRALVQRDRAKAIAIAIRQAGSDDVVLIAGKGHEAYQEVHGIKTAFDDLVQARLHLGEDA